MGLFDFLFSPKKSKNDIAIEIDLATGVLESCPICKTVVDKQNDDRLPAAREEAQRRFDKGDPALAIFEGRSEELLELLDTVRKPLPYLCDCENAG